eukprot:TRINITY_DN2612_c0_g1_i2.p1 TRINITY_DN2612_c0_g1~~TRINITY_DN2612_c0_g1_i2.p1  ORF type:complete len:305 (+),score=12.15 TRINITY_DN2612_c0_g1_i2:439-1353(+)
MDTTIWANRKRRGFCRYAAVGATRNFGFRANRGQEFVFLGPGLTHYFFAPVKIPCDSSRATISVSKQLTYQNLYLFYTASRILNSTASISLKLNFQNSSGPLSSVTRNLTALDWRRVDPPPTGVAVRARSQSRTTQAIDTTNFVYIYGSALDLSSMACGNVSCGTVALRSLEWRITSSKSTCSFFLFSVVAERDYDLPPPAPSAPKPPSQSRGQLTPDEVYAMGSTPAVLSTLSSLNSTGNAASQTGSGGTPAWVVPYAVTFAVAVVLVIGLGVALHVWKRWKAQSVQPSDAGTDSSTSETEMV